MRRIYKLPRIGTKHISREALARCAEVTEGISGLAKIIREEETFDVILVSTCQIDKMEVEVVKYDGIVPFYESYCGHAVQKAMEKVLSRYCIPKLSSSVRLEPMC